MGKENWFKHDIDSRLVPGMALFIKKTGAEGYGLFWAIVEEMYRTNKPEQTRTNLTNISKTMQIDEQKFLFILDAAIEYDLWEQNDEVVTSKRAASEMDDRAARYNKIKGIRAEAGRKSGVARRTKRTNANKHEPEEIRLDKSRLDISISEKHPSPLAPNHLTRYKTELIGMMPHVWLTDGHYKRLCDTLGIPNAEHLMKCLEEYSSKKKKWLEHSDHYRTLLSWDRMAKEKGKIFYIHPKSGAGYYYERDIEASGGGGDYSGRPLSERPPTTG